MKIDQAKKGGLDMRKKKLVLYRKMNIKKRKQALVKHNRKLEEKSANQWQYMEGSRSDNSASPSGDQSPDYQYSRKSKSDFSKIEVQS